jgi:hypothetical protein
VELGNRKFESRWRKVRLQKVRRGKPSGRAEAGVAGQIRLAKIINKNF